MEKSVFSPGNPYLSPNDYRKINQGFGDPREAICEYFTREKCPVFEGEPRRTTGFERLFKYAESVKMWAPIDRDGKFFLPTISKNVKNETLVEVVYYFDAKHITLTWEDCGFDKEDTLVCRVVWILGDKDSEIPHLHFELVSADKKEQKVLGGF